MSKDSFAMIPNSALVLKPRALQVYVLLATYADRRGVAWPSVATLAERLGTSEDTVQRQLVALRAAGFIEIVERRNHGVVKSSTVHRLVHHPAGRTANTATAREAADLRVTETANAPYAETAALRPKLELGEQEPEEPDSPRRDTPQAHASAGTAALRLVRSATDRLRLGQAEERSLTRIIEDAYRRGVDGTTIEPALALWTSEFEAGRAQQPGALRLMLSGDWQVRPSTVARPQMPRRVDTSLLPPGVHEIDLDDPRLRRGA